MTRYLKIGEFADLIGVHSTTVRNYEEEGIIIPHHKSPKGQRLYTQEQVNAVLAGDYDSPILKGGIKAWTNQ